MADGKKLTRLIRQSDLTIHTTTGRITLSANLQIYDQTGTVYVPPQGQVQFDLHPTVAIVSATTPPITLYHTKRLQVNRSMNVANQASVLSNPAFTTELTSRMGIAYRQHVQAFDRADSQIYKTIRTYLDSHPEYASLPDYQKTELYHRVL